MNEHECLWSCVIRAIRGKLSLRILRPCFPLRAGCGWGWGALVLPFPDRIRPHPAEFQQLVLVELQFGAAVAGNRKVVLQEDGFLGTDFLAIAAINTAQHVDDEIVRLFLDVLIGGAFGAAARDDADGLGRADKLAELAGPAFEAPCWV